MVADSGSGGRRVIAKFFIYGFNLIFIAVGVGVLSLGVWLKCDPRFKEFLSERYNQVVRDDFPNPSTLYISAYLLIVVGALLIVVSFIGCCGAIHDNQCALFSYFFLVLVLFLVCLGFGILFFIRRDSIENEVGDSLRYMVQNYNRGPGVIQEALDALQIAFRCCGDSGCKDFHDLKIDLPRSCDITCDSCRQRIFRSLRAGYTIVGIIFIIVLIAQVIGMIVTLTLCCWIRESDDDLYAGKYAMPYYPPPVEGYGQYQEQREQTQPVYAKHSPPPPYWTDSQQRRQNQKKR